MDLDFDFEAELKRCDEKIKHAEDTAGDTEIRDAILEKAKFLLKHNKKDEAIKTFELCHEKSIGTARKMDLVFTMMEIYFTLNDMKSVQKCIKR